MPRRDGVPVAKSGDAVVFQPTFTRAPPDSIESCTSTAAACVPAVTSNGTFTLMSKPNSPRHLFHQ